MGARNYGGNTSNNNSYTSPSNSNFEAANANYISSSSTKSYGSGSGYNPTSNQNNSSSPLAQDIKNKISSLPSKLMGNTRPSHELSNFGSLNAAVTHASAHSHASAGSGGDWSYAPPTASSPSTDEESGLVDDITNPGGSSTLSFQALEQFCARSALLDQYKVSEFLFKKLESRTWQVRHKALSAIESLLLSSTGNVIRDNCIENRVVFESLLGGMQAATREKAKQVLTLLGISVDSLPPPSSAPSSNVVHSPAPSYSAPSLLGISEPEPERSPAPSSLFAGLSVASSPAQPEPQQTYTPPTKQPSLISIDNTEEEEQNTARNTSLLSFLEASANVPPSPSLLRDLGSTAPPNENDDSPLIASSPGPSQLSLDVTPLSFNAPVPATTSSPLIDLSNDDSYVPPSSDILSQFRNTNSLNSSTPIPAAIHDSNSPLSSSQPISPPSSFLADLMETPPSSLEELLATSDTVLAPSASNTTPNSPFYSSTSSSPFGPPPKVPMAPNAQLKPARSTIPQSALQQYNANQQQFSSFTPPPQPSPAVIKTTSATSVFNPIYSIPRAVSSPVAPPSPSSSSSSSSFNFVQQQKKPDAFGDLVSIHIKQMGTK